jgi:hypothetical protein
MNMPASSFTLPPSYPSYLLVFSLSSLTATTQDAPHFTPTMVDCTGLHCHWHSNCSMMYLPSKTHFLCMVPDYTHRFAFPHISFPIGCNLPVLKTISIPGAHDCPIIPNWIHCHTKMPKNGNIMIKPMKSSVGFILEQIRECLNVSEKTVFDGAIIAVIMLVAHRPQIISFM